MKQYKIFYLKQLEEAPDPPDEGYRKLYAKDDGWYGLDHEGNEVLLRGHTILDGDENPVEQRALLQFAHPFSVFVDGDKIVVTLDFGEDADTMFMHGNEFHTEEYITMDDLIAHAEETEGVHGLDEIWAAILALQGIGMGERGAIKTSEAEVSVNPVYKSYIADTTSNHVEFVLPLASGGMIDFVFRRSGGSYAMTVLRSGMDVIEVDGAEWDGIEIDEPGWVALHSDGERWHVTMDSGNIQATV